MKKIFKIPSLVIAFLLLLSLFVLLPVQAERLLPRLVDNANILSQSENANLLNKLDTLSGKYNFDFVIVTIESLDGANINAYADDFFDYFGYGTKDTRDGILLLVSISDREMAFSTSGYGIYAFTDVGMIMLEDQLIDDFGDNQFYAGFLKFAELSDDYLEAARSGNPYDIEAISSKREFFQPTYLLLAILGGALIAFFITASMRNQLKSVAKQKTATNYMLPGSMRIYGKNDLFLYSTLTRTKRAQQEGSSRQGGSSTHTSSSGRTHGGSSRKF